MKIKGFIQEFCQKLKLQLGNDQPKWFKYFWNGYILSKHLPQSLKEIEQDQICGQIFTLILYLLDYHTIDIRSIDAFAGIERTSRMISAGQFNDSWILMPRFLLASFQGISLEQYRFSPKEKELCGEWNMKETVGATEMLKTAFRMIRL
ncbi:hypothetical protein GEMRC1_012613 [Eukaryota sp. GEM-RC1]